MGTGESTGVLVLHPEVLEHRLDPLRVEPAKGNPQVLLGCWPQEGLTHSGLLEVDECVTTREHV